jgi:RecA/RadA recombinase
MGLREKLLNNATIKQASTLQDSALFEERSSVPTNIPIVNVALSGRPDGGLQSGVTMIAGQSKHFKSGFALILAAAYLKHHKDAILLFYDSEFGIPKSYLKTFGIPEDRVIHIPITDVEQLKHDLMVQLEGKGKDKPGIERGDHVIIVIDSIGNLASRKEVEDAVEGKSVADMTRAKAMKSLFRMVTPHLTLKDIPLIVVNHTYKEIGMYPKDIVGGGTGSYYSSDTIWIIGRRQEKDDKEVVGYDFIINVEKSRFVKEKSKIPVSVRFDGGIDKWSGLLELALEGGFVEAVGRSYIVKSMGTDKISSKVFEETRNSIFLHLLTETDFSEWLKNKYTLANETGIMQATEEDD